MIGHKGRDDGGVLPPRGARLRCVNRKVFRPKKLLRRLLLDVLVIRVRLIASWGVLGRDGRCSFRLRLG